MTWNPRHKFPATDARAADPTRAKPPRVALRSSGAQVDSGLAAAAGTAAGAIYFAIGESTIPKEANCTYLAAPLTDVLAWAAGASLMARGMKTRDPWIAFIGGSIVGIHVAQFASHKTGRNSLKTT